MHGQYVVGISLTHGAARNRQHIWTFASGLSEVTRFPNAPPIFVLVIQHHPVLFLHSLEMTTSVRVVYTLNCMIIIICFLMMFSGMVRTVHPPAHAVSSTTLHGLQTTCPMQQLMILN